MKLLLATTAIALVLANGAFAESHVAADGTEAEGTMTTDAPADTEATTDTMEPEEAAEPDATAEPMEPEADAAPEAPADAGTMTDTEAATTDMPADGSMAEMGAPMMEMEGYTTTVNADVTAEQLTGMRVYGPNDENVGEIGDLVIAEDGTVSDVIVDVGGFLGMGEKPVSIAFDQVQLLKQTEGDDMRAYVSMTEDQMKELPKYEAPES